MTEEITYRTYNAAEIQIRYACPFCIRVAFPNSEELVSHVGSCDYYHALDENLPISPESSIIIDTDIPYTLEEYLVDEELYFRTMISVANVWPPAAPPTADLAGAEEYFTNVISTTENTRLTVQRIKNIVFRLITTFYRLPQHVIQTMMASMYDIKIGDELAI